MTAALPPSPASPIASPRRAIFNMAAKGASIAVERGAQFALVLVAAPLLGADAFGRYAFAASLGAILAFGTDLGLTIWTTRTLARDPAASPQVLGTGLRLRLSAAAVVLLGLAGAALGVERAELRWAILALGVAALARAFLDHARAVFRAHERLGDEATVNTVVAVLATLGGLGALAATGRGLPALAVGVMVGTLAGAGYGFTVLGRRYGPWTGSWSGPADRMLAQRMVREARPFWWAGILTLAYARADVVLLGLLTSDAEVGAYRVARQLVEVANQLPVLMLTALFPQLARAAQAPGAHLRRLENHVCLLLGVGGVAAGGLLAAASAPAVHLLLGPGFARSIPTLRVLAGAVPLMFVNAGLLHFFIARDRGSLNVAFAGAMVGVNVVANLLLGGRFGAVGSGLATLVTEAALSACCLYALVILRRDGDVTAPLVR